MDMKKQARSLDIFSRRAFVASAACSLLGVRAIPAFSAAAARDIAANATAKRVIYLYMNGAMSHMDTFDPKPGTDEQGETEVLKTNVPGMQIANFPLLAKQMDRIALVRSMSTDTGAHAQAKYLMKTSYEQRSSIRHPSMGAWMQKFQGKTNKELPDSVIIEADTKHPANGFLEAAFSPLPIGRASAGLQDSKAPDYLKPEHFDKRMNLINEFDRSFTEKHQQASVKSYTDFYRDTVALLKSKDLKVFDISEEKQEVKDKYGDNTFGQGCLLARRLVQNNVRFVEVNSNGWDTHDRNFERVPEKTSDIDKALTALLDDLKEQGMLEDTMVVLTSEFGRTPKINVNAGRDHHPACFTSLLAGGGVKGGQVYGKSDEKAFRVAENGVGPADLNATIAHALGLPLKKEVFSATKRPFKVAHDGTPILSLF